MVPRRFGGRQADFTTFLQVSSELARGDGSTAWVSTLMNVCSWLAGLYPEQAQRDIFENDPDARICGVVAPTATTTYAEGGQTVTGKWGFASGSRSEEHTSELQSLMRNSYAVFCLKKKTDEPLRPRRKTTHNTQ